MFIHCRHLEQDTEDWHKWRTTVIGSSDASVIMGENPWRKPLALLEEKLGLRPGVASTAAMKRGKQLEPFARELYSTHKRIRVHPSIVQNIKRPWQAASLDGIDKNDSLIVEIKCGVKAFDYTQRTKTVPRYNYGQLMHILAVTGLKSIDYFCYSPSASPILIHVPRDDDYIERLIDAESRFCRELIARGATLATATRRVSKNRKVSAQVSRGKQLNAGYVGDVRDGKYHGYGCATFDNGHIYKGEWLEGRRHGQGTYEWPSGERYVGEWTDGEMTGVGTFTYPNGAVYAGRLINGVRDGYGEMNYPDCSVYSGEWRGNELHGIGSLKLSNGDQYVGEWSCSKFKGRGRYTKLTESGRNEHLEGDFNDFKPSGFSLTTHVDGQLSLLRRESPTSDENGVICFLNGNVYVGDVTDGVPHGQGKLLWPDGGVYIGQWDRGGLHGNGVMIWADGDRYSGSWVRSKRSGTGRYCFKDGTMYDGYFDAGIICGQGVMSYPDGSKYEGSWKDNEFHGEGILTLASGRQYKGKWIRGRLRGKSRPELVSEEKLAGTQPAVPGSTWLAFSDGSQYVGALSGKKRHGIGTIHYRDGSHFTGSWRNNKRHGHGTYTFVTGGSVIGEYLGSLKNDRFHGQGVFVWANGSRYSGLWKDGMMSGEGTFIDREGHRYVGAWRNGLPDGTGTMSYPNGDEYVGEWRKGLRCGDGKLVYADGQTYLGRWIDNQRMHPTLGGGASRRDGAPTMFPKVLVAFDSSKQTLI